MRWIVRRFRHDDGTLFEPPIWLAIDPQGWWSAAHDTWAQAMRWAEVCRDADKRDQFFQPWLRK